MNQQERIGIWSYVIGDSISASITWMLFLLYRKNELSRLGAIKTYQLINHADWINILFIIPCFWILFHYLSGAYFNIYRKSRLIEVYRTLIISIIGCLLIFFKPILNDQVSNYNYYYKAFLYYLVVQWIITSIGRHLILTRAKQRMRKQKFNYKTLIIGGNGEAIKLYEEIHKESILNDIIGFVTMDDQAGKSLSQFIPCLGTIDQIDQIIQDRNITEVIIGIDNHEHHQLQELLGRLSHSPVIVKISPDMYDIISGSVRTSNVWGTILIEIYPELMPDWQRVIKRALDVTVSGVLLLLLIPVYILVAIKVKFSSPGSIFYGQERVGLHGKIFTIWKFRSMYQNSEHNGPALSSEEDPRITPWGRIMRKWRIDELPQFLNILKGDMSLVGPRPERKYFIDQIIKDHPQYKYLHRVKPGLSSWGMVKYGYASNLDQMIQRMRYDLLYIKNCSLALDTKIMFYTILVILQGRGK
jgi:exopolysaccharide biosynthesis polyprenyl glycosylphosphotransferase